ncbi:LacI family transcriptional regulator [Paenibacillus hemerocallicola]|jgi:DNA-binding LacI/PurR family transcriptional regulator|uniref:LacI family transcriptional regulator n=1 Tax=Paenibacillus hemerocallicola TaxID=1172614 RepID=A0A5C4T745_9BACL|nr:LacI family DNA-binding transcriptional regulator [Paenibacillus hemerocallicola]TNJ64187.1 LacI family transcriptional regulator [Paenibacillus hemerocallicola]
MPTFEDIAKIAGVSKATVSLSLSDSPKISMETKVKIRNIAKNIGYDLSGMEGGKWLRNRSIGILHVSHNPDFEKDFFRDTLIGVTEDATNKGYDVVFIGSHMQKNINDTSEDIAEKVMQSGVEGVVVISSIPNLKGFGKLQDMHFPMVFVGNRKVDGSARQIFNVCSDHYSGGKMAAEYLFDDLKHTRIALVGRHNMPHWEQDRANGFFSHLRNSGLADIENDKVLVSERYKPDDEGWTKLSRIEPTAIFAVNASIGISVLHYLRSVQKRIPQDVSVIVFDDFASFPYEHPPVTVIKQNKEALGSLAVKVLTDLLEKSKYPPRQMLISTELIERESCAAAQI